MGCITSQTHDPDVHVAVQCGYKRDLQGLLRDLVKLLMICSHHWIRSGVTKLWIPLVNMGGLPPTSSTSMHVAVWHAQNHPLLTQALHQFKLHTGYPSKMYK